MSRRSIVFDDFLEMKRDKFEKKVYANDIVDQIYDDFRRSRIHNKKELELFRRNKLSEYEKRSTDSNKAKSPVARNNNDRKKLI